MATARGSRKSWQPPLTMRAAVRRALDRSGGNGVDGDAFARSLVGELHAAGYRISSTRRPVQQPQPRQPVGRPMTSAEAQAFGFTVSEES